MARKRTHRVKKIEPAVLRLAFTVEGESINGENYIDLSQVASLLNRRFYRQGLNWAVGAMTFVTASTTTGLFNIEKLPSTWILGNSWEKGMRSWQRMNREALDESPSVRPRFLDFKIYADAQHHAKGIGANLLPGTLAGGFATPGEWFSSKAVIPVAAGAVEGAVNEFEFVATGANFPGVSPASGLNAISLIQGYANSRGLPYPEDPNVPDAAADADDNTPENWIAAMFNEGTQQTDEVLDTMINQNNQAPYPFENDGVHVDTMYPNGATQLAGLEFHDMVVVSGTTVSSRNRIQGGNFPCGLIKVTSSGITGAWNLFVDLVPGHHRGYLCEPMTEM